MHAYLQSLIPSVFSPAHFDFWAAHINPAWSWNRPLARILAREATAAGYMTLVLKPNRHVPPFAAGQHVNVSTEIAGRRVTRSYSPSRIPGQPGLFGITVKRMEGGKASTWLHEQARVGDVLEIGPAFGEMVLPADAQNLVFLAAGSGITPFISLLRDWETQGTKGRLTLLYWARTRAELCFARELEDLAARHDNFRVHFLLTQEAQAGRINAAQLAAHIPEPALSQVFACGPAGFVDEARRLSTAAQGFLGEAFSLPAPAASSDARVQVHLSRSNRTLSVPQGQPLLLALEEQGLSPAYGCRMGICNTCVCTRESGTTELLRTGEREQEPGALRICVSAACSDLTIDL